MLVQARLGLSVLAFPAGQYKKPGLTAYWPQLPPKNGRQLGASTFVGEGVGGTAEEQGQAEEEEEAEEDKEK